MFQVVKRDGELDEFKMGKITAAIDKAFDAKGKNSLPGSTTANNRVTGINSRDTTRVAG